MSIEQKREKLNSWQDEFILSLNERLSLSQEVWQTKLKDSHIKSQIKSLIQDSLTDKKNEKTPDQSYDLESKIISAIIQLLSDQKRESFLAQRLQEKINEHNKKENQFKQLGLFSEFQFSDLELQLVQTQILNSYISINQKVIDENKKILATEIYFSLRKELS